MDGNHRSPTANAGQQDEAAFRRLFAETYGPLSAYVRRRSNDGNTADDVVADVFLVAWRRWDELSRFEPKLPWLYRVAANTMRNANRSSGRHLRLVQAVGNTGVSSHDEHVDSSIMVREALASLDDDDQEVLRLVAWEGLTHAEAGVVLDCSANAVSQRLRRARDRLALALKPPAAETG